MIFCDKEFVFIGPLIFLLIIGYNGFIPFFVAIPITDIFDSFNMWRIIGGLIFLKWFFTVKPDLKFRSALPFALMALLFIVYTVCR